MTKTQLMKKVRELNKNASQLVMKRIDQLVESGAIELSDYIDDYRLPKILICAALHDVSEDYSPFDKEARRTVKNLSNF